ncbi:hypothetical protein KAW80_02690 [Candidatus Babeliales bacterium]|nr:hypothetical protein [Candidatus Babeliales bacterium]
MNKNEKIIEKTFFNKKIITYAVATACVLATFTAFFVIRKHDYYNKEHWVTIFIHGNFNTGLGMLSLTDVFKDNLNNTTYKKIIKKIRKDPFFYQEQPILQKGLVKVEPSFDVSKIKNKFGVYPILSGYKKILETIKPNKEANHFYTYGWSGLMGQTERRRWAIRFYNALTEELKNYDKEGIKPKIRILAHSHGGNVSLNLALINDITNNISYEEKSDEAIESLFKISEAVSKLPDKETSKTFKNQKKFDYKPSVQNLTIDELIIFGTPLQAENVHCLESNVFKKIYNIYSDQDVVQKMDFISTKQRTSKQRLDFKNFKNQNMVQAKIMVDKVLKVNEEKSSWWNKISFKNIFEDKTKDPTHKDLWFLAWNPDYCQPGFPLNPLPLVTIAPLILNAIEKIKFPDIDINLSFLSSHLEILILRHDTKTVENKIRIPLSIIDELKAQTLPWKPEDLTRENTFKKMYSQLS